MSVKLTPQALAVINALSPLERVIVNNDKFTTPRGLMTPGDVADLPPVARNAHPGELCILDIVLTYKALAASTPKTPGDFKAEQIHNGYAALRQLYNFNRDFGNALGADVPAID